MNKARNNVVYERLSSLAPQREAQAFSTFLDLALAESHARRADALKIKHDGIILDIKADHLRQDRVDHLKRKRSTDSGMHQKCSGSK